MYENELEPTLEYVNNKLLSDLDDVDPKDFCDAAEHVVKMLDKLATRLMELKEEIRSSEEKTWLGSYAWFSWMFPVLDGGMKCRLQALADEAERLYGMAAKSRTQIELTMAEIKRTRKQRGEEKRKEEKRKRNKLRKKELRRKSSKQEY